MSHNLTYNFFECFIPSHATFNTNDIRKPRNDFFILLAYFTILHFSMHDLYLVNPVRLNFSHCPGWSKSLYVILAFWDPLVPLSINIIEVNLDLVLSVIRIKLAA
jgi:hypothetical protein